MGVTLEGLGFRVGSLPVAAGSGAYVKWVDPAGKSEATQYWHATRCHQKPQTRSPEAPVSEDFLQDPGFHDEELNLN